MALRIESRPYLTNDFWLSHLPKDKTGGYNIGYLENLEKKGELFMLEFLASGKALSVLAAIGVIGIVSKLITRSLYKRLLKETDNMAMTKNKNLKALKQKLENAYRLNQNIVNTQAYLEKQLYGFRFMNLSLDTWNNLSMQMVILGLLAGGAGSFLAYWFRLDSYYIVLYASIGALSSLLLTFMDSSFNIIQKQQRLETVLLEYMDNSVFVRAARENTGRDAAVSRAALTAQDWERDRQAREDDINLSAARGEEARERSRDEEFKERMSREGNKDSLARGEETKNGLVKEEMGRANIRSIKSRNSKADDLLRAVRTMKEEDEQESPVKLREMDRAERGSSAPGTSKKARNAARDAGYDGPEADSQARRDIDYLKQSLEQIAASKDRLQEEPPSRERDWLKNLNGEELKLIGEIMQQYFSRT